MLKSFPTGRSATRVLGCALVACAFGVLAPSVARAHFTLDAPPSWMSQDALGSPQKESPCGNESGGTATYMITAFQPGQTITLKWTEIIAHDGWFRIALSYKNRTDLVDPPYAINAAGNSTDAGIESPPVAPVLVDGLFPHTAASITTPKSYSYDLTLPTTPCDKCTLQLIQIMLNHPNNQPYGYTYHHCADISLQAGADGGTTISDGGGNGGGAGGSSGSTGSSDSGGSSGADDGGGSAGHTAAPAAGSSGCTVVGHRAPAAGGAVGVVALAALSRRRRRRAQANVVEAP
jgi:uncharacterized membrane protein YgcG